MRSGIERAAAVLWSAASGPFEQAPQGPWQDPMTAVAFDTLKFARSLREKAKLSPEQAEGFADAIAEAIQGDLATKADIKALGASTQADTRALGASTQADIQALRTSTEADSSSVKADLRETELRLEAKIEASKAEIIKWMFGTIGFQTLVIVGAVLTLARVLKP